MVYFHHGVFSFYVQIYVEVERARLTHKLAKMKEEEGNIIEAANIIQELQVETYGSMEKREKVRLSLLHTSIMDS
jgi:26S proteasome regulatory subunit N5